MGFVEEMTVEMRKKHLSIEGLRGFGEAFGLWVVVSEAEWWGAGGESGVLTS